VPDEDEVPADKRSLLGSKNQFPWFGTGGIFLTDLVVVDYRRAKSVFAIVLDEARNVASCRPLGSAPGGRNFSIILKTLDFLLTRRINVKIPNS